MSARQVCEDLRMNHARHLSTKLVQSESAHVEDVAMDKEFEWHYDLPVFTEVVSHISIGRDGTTTAMLLKKGEQAQKQWADNACHDLKHKKNGARFIVRELKNWVKERGNTEQETIWKTITYFENNLMRMKYAEYQKMGYPIGSGVTEAACKTGLGDIEGNEDVYGLQRAFKIAGVQYIIMSLWQVPDAQTQELMTAFYTNWLSRKMAIPEAFRAAQKTMQEKYEHPFFWAGFILLR